MNYQPFVIYRIVERQVELAMWTLSDGRRALVLFSGEESAQRYFTEAKFADDWKIFQPEQKMALDMMRAYAEAGAQLAVIDPSNGQAKEMYDIQEILMGE